jgi:uncharacterized RDD family membrane protein YckC
LEQENYTVVIDGKPKGPFSLSELQELHIKPDTFVRKPGMPDYKEAHEMQELRDFLGFKKREIAPQYFASFDQRLVASMVDYLLIIATYIVVMFIIYVIVPINWFRIGLFALLVLIPLTKLIYGSLAEASPKQATWGKALMNLRVTDEQGARLELPRSFGRNFGKIISNLTLCFGYIYSFMNKKQQCLHDVIAGTLVVKDRLI